MRRNDEWNSAYPRDRSAMPDGCAPDAVQMQHARLQPLDDSEQRIPRRAPLTREIDQLNACFGEEPINPRALHGVAGAIDADDYNLRPGKRLMARELDHDRRRATALGMKVLDDVEDHGRKVGVGSVSGRVGSVRRRRRPASIRSRFRVAFHAKVLSAPRFEPIETPWFELRRPKQALSLCHESHHR
jgi:hypothetical protein